MSPTAMVRIGPWKPSLDHRHGLKKSPPSKMLKSQLIKIPTAIYYGAQPSPRYNKPTSSNIILGGFSSSLQSLQEHQNAPPFQLITPPATRAEPLPQHGHEFRKGLPSANPT